MMETMQKILVVDDEPCIREVLFQVLQDEGYQAATAGSGEEALELFRQTPFPLVFVDIVMPGMSGLELLEELKRIQPDSQVIIITSHASLETAISALRCGAYDYLVKPFDELEVVLGAARRALGHLLLERRNEQLLTQLDEKNRRLEQLNARLQMDIRLREQAEAALRESERRYRGFVQNFLGIAYRLNADLTPIFMHGEVQTITGYSQLEFLNHQVRWSELVYEPDRARYARELEELQASGEMTLQREYRIVAKSGGLRWVQEFAQAQVIAGEGGKVLREVQGAIYDITARKEAEARAEQLAHFDTLTGLPNRARFRDMLAQELALAERQPQFRALLFIGLDRFRELNYCLSHDCGDHLLQEVAERLRGCTRKSDILARFSGDEFVLLLRSNQVENQVNVVAEKMLKELGQPYQVGSDEVVVNVSIGIALTPQDALQAETLISRADLAMNAAKTLGGGCFRYFSEPMNDRVQRHRQLVSGMRAALQRGEFSLVYQPKIDLLSEQLIGMEALLRWQHPELGAIPPCQFIPVAEETGIIVELGQWVLETACAQNRAWQQAGFAPLTVAVNLSGVQLQKRGFEERVRQVLETTGLAPEYLELELTESSLMEERSALATLNALRRLGVQLSVDDFGTGYSSLSYLKHFPIDRIKIDRSFLRDLPRDKEAGALVEAMVAMAHRLGIKVLAEGVETEEQLQYVALLNCDEAQGFFFAYPLPVDDFTALLEEVRSSLDLSDWSGQEPSRG